MKIRLLIIILGLPTILSCDNSEKEKRLFGTLYQNKFSIRDDMTIEYVDSAFFVILTGKDSIDGYTLGKWEIESGLWGTFIKSQTIDSAKLKVTDNSPDLVKYEFEGKTTELKRATVKKNFNIVGNWKCLNCRPLPPLMNSESDDMRIVSYVFRDDKTFQIEEEDWKGKGPWDYSTSGQLIILNKIYKLGDLIKGDLLIMNDLNNDTLTLKRKDDMGLLVTRKLVRTQN